MEYLISLVWMLLESMAFLFFSASFLELRSTKRRSGSIALAVWVLSFGISNAPLPSWIVQPIMALLSVALMVCLFRGPWLQTVLIGILGYILVAVLDSVFLFGTAHLLQISLEQLVWRKTMYVVVATAGKALSVFLAWLMMRIHPLKKGHRMDTKWFLLLSVFPVVSTVMMLTLFSVCRELEDLTAPVALFCALLGIANVAIVYVIVSIEKDTEIKQKNDLLAQQMQLQTTSILALEKAYRAQRESGHDFQNHLCTILELLAQQQYAQSRQYIQELVQMQAGRSVVVNTHHPIVDAILTQKYQLAQEANITMQLQVNDLSGLHLQASELVVLLSNLLDNAIEACQKLDADRQIQLTLTMQDSVFLSIRNTSLPVFCSGDGIPTTKANPNAHGYGLAGACRVLENVHAEYTYQYQNGWFQFTAEIPCVSEECGG